MRRGIRSGLISAAAAASFCVSVGTASADTYNNYRGGVETKSQAVCNGVMDAQYDLTTKYWVTRGAVSTAGGGNCQMRLEHNSGSGWVAVSYTYETTGPWVRTGWHADPSGSQSRVCVNDATITSLWACSTGW